MGSGSAPLELYDRPANLFVAGFIGSPSMNVLDVTVGGGRLVLEDAPSIAAPAIATMWPQGVGTVETEGCSAAGKTGYSPLPMWEGNLAGYAQGTPFLGAGYIQ